jgi:cytochrome oxidase Cu insertion factor (SCO1/SenC/PrrC family)
MSSDVQSGTSPRTQAMTTPASSGAALPLALSAAVLIAMAFGGWKWYQVRQFQIAKSEAIPASAIGPPLKDFELTERSGKLFKSTDMLGKVWVASYFFTTCPGQCLRLNANVQVLANEPDLKDVTWVSITCDPDNDTVEALRVYADRWNADPKRWLFCRGDLEYIQRIAKGMKIFLSLKGHQDYLIVIDKAGNIRKILDGTSEIECNRLHKVLLECLEEKAPDDTATSGKAGAETSADDKPAAEKAVEENSPDNKPTANAAKEKTS